MSRDQTVPPPVGNHLVTVGIVVVAVLMLMSSGAFVHGPDWLVIGLTIAMIAPLPWRSARPTTVGLILVVPHLVQLVLVPWPIAGNLAVPFTLHAIGRRCEVRTARLWLAAAMVSSLALAMRVAYTSAPEPWQASIEEMLYVFALAALVSVASWALGRSRRKEEQRLLAAHNEAERGRQLAAANERSRIARELHDVLAHSLSVIAVQADGMAYLTGPDAPPGDPQQRRASVHEAAKSVRTTARTSLDEVRTLVAALRTSTDETELSPRTDLTQLPDLIAKVRRAGLRVEFVEIGTSTDHPELGPAAEFAAHRVVQESLTNVLKHAGDDPSVTVELRHTATGLTVMVADDGLGAATGSPGYGLIGMQERVRAVGGRFDAGPRAPKGFRVTAHIPALPATTSGDVGD